MRAQIQLFDSKANTCQTQLELPAGFRYMPELISPAEEEKLLGQVRKLPFRDFEFHGHRGKRRVISFGWRYDFSIELLAKAEPIPEFLMSLRNEAAVFAGCEPELFEHVMVTEYSAGASIGWHKDKAVFGEVVGLSLLSAGTFRMRRRVAVKQWERVKLRVDPRSAYLLSGEARLVWEHSIPPLNSLRYSVTFRTLRRGCPLA